MANRLLLTRALAQAEAFAIDMRAATSLEPVISPMQKMVDLPVEVDLTGISSLAFTSKNGVEAFARKSHVRLPAYCVGEATAQCARNLGFEALAASGNVESLSAKLPQSGVLHLHGVHVTSGLGTKSQAIYEQESLPLEPSTQALLSTGKIAAIALFSPRSSKLLAKAWQPNWPVPARLYALSEAVALPLLPLGTPLVCPTPSAASMLRLLSADFPA